jgi:hypothetical protein
MLIALYADTETARPVNCTCHARVTSILHSPVLTMALPSPRFLQGDIVAASPSFSHMLPQYFKDPKAYDPERFASPREEDKQKPFTYLGFGGGRHGCLGQNFAYLQVSRLARCSGLMLLLMSCTVRRCLHALLAGLACWPDACTCNMVPVGCPSAVKSHSSDAPPHRELLQVAHSDPVARGRTCDAAMPALLPQQQHAQRLLPTCPFLPLQIKTIWSVLLRDFDFEMVTAVPEPDYHSMVIGPLPGRVRYTRKKLVA